MFWGLQIEPNLRYSQEVPDGFRVTKATLLVPEGSVANAGPVQVFIEQHGIEYAIATLCHGKKFDSSLDLRFSEGEDICFFLRGDGVVFLTGHHLDGEDCDFDSGSGQFIESGESEDEEVAELGTNGATGDSSNESSDEDSAGDEACSGEEDEDEEEEESPEGSEEESEDGLDGDTAASAKNGNKRPQKVVSNGKAPEAKKIKLAANQTTASEAPKSKSVGVADKRSVAPNNGTNSQGVPTVLKVEDIKSGKGLVAKRGKTVHVYYVGSLMNGKKFDSCTSGKPFSFKLGTGSVIKGWDKGLEGMRVGGKRRLVIPAALAYGKTRTGPIPPNSALKFEIELVTVS